MNVGERDLNVLMYIYEMKFSTAIDVFKMFFESEKSANSRYALIRLNKLAKNGYLNIFTNKLYRNKFYYISDSGLGVLRNKFRDHLFPKKAPSKMDTRFFEHDRYVSLCRIFLEKKGVAKGWVSERVIFHNMVTKSGEYRSKYMLKNLQKSQIPDGLFETNKGELCAFELELSLKSKRELREKLVMLNNESKQSHGLFKRVLLVASSVKIRANLEKINNEISAHFKILDLERMVNHEY